MLDKRDITILYVDDEEPNLFLFEATFENSFAVLTASSGAEGLKKLETAHTKIIVVISDMNMPGMNGVEFIRKAHSTYLNIGYFILTGYGFNDEIDLALKQNIVDRFFTKPFKPEEIELAIDDFRDIKLRA